MSVLNDVQPLSVVGVLGKCEKGAIPMATFKIKNLMVDVVSSAPVPDLDKLCKSPTLFCYITGCQKKPSIHQCDWGAPSIACAVRACSMLPTMIPCISDTCLVCNDPSVACEGTHVPIACGDSELLVIDLEKLVVNPELIKDVQAELDQVLKAVAKRGVEINKEMAPQTLAQAELLEKELTAALEEVKRLKGSLK
jgi:hypothetical protein